MPTLLRAIFSPETCSLFSSGRSGHLDQHGVRASDDRDFQDSPGTVKITRSMPRSRAAEKSTPLPSLSTS